jgi:hypothetical protein
MKDSLPVFKNFPDCMLRRIANLADLFFNLF